MKSLAVVFVGGLLFGFGLGLSGLVYQEVVLSFLQVKDLGLGLMMAAALAATTPIYQLAPRLLSRPWLGAAFERFPRHVSRNNVGGAVLFGIGWGLSGICPGAAIGSLGAGNFPVLLALGGMLLGAYAQGVTASRTAQGDPGTRSSPS